MLLIFAFKRGACVTLRIAILQEGASLSSFERRAGQRSRNRGRKLNLYNSSDYVVFNTLSRLHMLVSSVRELLLESTAYIRSSISYIRTYIKNWS